MVTRIYNKLKFFFQQVLIKNIGYFGFIRSVQNPTQPITFEYWYKQKVCGVNKHVPWPVHHSSKIIGVSNITIGEGSFPGYMPGSYIQGLGKISIGEGCIFAPNIGIISSNHDIYDNTKHVFGEVVIGNYCWIGMGAIVLPNIKLGDFTIVAAGAIVTKSFEKGYCVIGGNPAKVLKELDPKQCVRFLSNTGYIGYKKKKV